MKETDSPTDRVRMRNVMLLLFVTLLGAGTAHAQKTPGATAGDTVRVWTSLSPGQMNEGRLALWTADSVSVSPVWGPQGQRDPFTFATSTLTRLEVQRARTRGEGFNASLRKGVVFGLFAAVATGLLLNDLEKDNVFLVAGLVGVGGVAAYGAYGYMAPGREWRMVHPR